MAGNGRFHKILMKTFFLVSLDSSCCILDNYTIFINFGDKVKLGQKLEIWIKFPPPPKKAVFLTKKVKNLCSRNLAGNGRFQKNLLKTCSLVSLDSSCCILDHYTISINFGDTMKLGKKIEILIKAFFFSKKHFF